MAFELPPLPYAYDALQPYMSKETLEFHHDKHHQAYVTNGNKLLEGTGLEGKSLEEIVKASYSKNAGLFNNAGQHYNHIHFWKWMKPERRRHQDPGRAGQGDRLRPRRLRQVQGRLRPGRHDAVRLRLGLAGAQGRQARDHQDAERREPAGPRRRADPRRRRVGALLLHRLPQPPPGLSQGLRRQPDQLGLRARDVREGDGRPLRQSRRPVEAAMRSSTGWAVAPDRPASYGIVAHLTIRAWPSRRLSLSSEIRTTRPGSSVRSRCRGSTPRSTTSAALSDGDRARTRLVTTGGFGASIRRPFRTAN